MNAFSLNSKLIGAYASCGDLGSAELLFQRTTNPNIFAFNWMISALAFHGCPEKSIGYFSLLQQSRTIPNKRGDCDAAFTLFSKMSKEGLTPDLVTWNAMFSGYIQSRRSNEALSLLQDMLDAGVKPNEVTLTGLLPVCVD
ncbi:hypothetical protein FXO38_14515 [Capsicum annuum]|nr:hypothetical protein FXO38_14515 [Capsicum annuum]KAF3674717.1 hypothetical protein FXO37_06257 [Capsicum annuum]